MTYYLGIDAGGTKTTCAVGDDNSVITTAIAGPGNIVRAGEAVARRSLHQAITQACTAAGISAQQVTSACIGAAGAASDEIVAMIRRIAAEILTAKVTVTGDMQIALEAAFPSAPGIIVIAGTGSIAYGRDANGNAARAGGWGFAVSDEGSAHWIGRNALAAFFRAYDLAQDAWELGPEGEASLAEKTSNRAAGRPPFFSALQEIWKVHSIEGLVRTVNATPPPNFSELLPSIVACAEVGDELCREVLARAGRELAQPAAVIIPRLFPDAPCDAALRAPVPVAMVGSVFRHSGLVRESFYNEIKKLDQRCSVVANVVDPVEGALRLARRS